jgi:predicted RNase H-like nuclease (RuvC/YqgF family)
MNQDNVWLNGQLKDAKSQIQDLRNVNQNLHIQIREMNDKRSQETNELLKAQERLAESITYSRNLQS